jgi:hypothetical protein
MNRRPLKKIASDLADVLKRAVKNVIEAGGLLNEAKEQLDEHGQWLPWLRDNFSLTNRTAERYMAVHALAAKFDTVSNLNFKVSGLYALVEADRDGNSEAVKAALAEAKDKWINADRVRQIVKSVRPQPPEETSDEAPSPDAAKDEELSSDGGSDEASPDVARVEAQPPDEDRSDEEDRDEERLSDDAPGDDEPEPEPDDDRPPPTPPPSLSPKQAAQLRQFEDATKGLLGLAARSAREFLATGISDFDLKTAAEFLQQVAREKEKLKGGDDVAPLKKTG